MSLFVLGLTSTANELKILLACPKNLVGVDRYRKDARPGGLIIVELVMSARSLITGES